LQQAVTENEWGVDMKFSDFMEVTLIEKGWSEDKKYRVVAKDGQKYLLRISPMEQYDRKKSEFECMQRVAALGIPMCEAIEFGTCEEGVYSLQTWIEGTDAETAVAELADDKVYEYGLEAGRILKKIHSIPAPADTEDWEPFFNRKMDRKIRMYQDCPLKYENGEAFIRHIEANRHLLKNRPLVYQHGDYHIGNFMIDETGRLVVIDFNRNEYGDPWEEFNRIVWCAQAAPAFATGMVDGYFDRNVPMEFWNLLALYIASNSLSSLPWSIRFGEGEIAVMRKQAADILSWYDDMKNPVPSWYQNGSSIK